MTVTITLVNKLTLLYIVNILPYNDNNDLVYIVCFIWHADNSEKKFLQGNINMEYSSGKFGPFS